MVHEENMSAGSATSRALLTNVPLQGVFDQLAERIPDVLPITGAGTTLVSPELAPQYIAASDTSRRPTGTRCSASDCRPSSGRVRACWRSEPARPCSLERTAGTPLAPTDPAREAAQTLADAAATYLISAKNRQESRHAADWFRERSLHDALKGQGPAPGTGELGSPREGDHGHPTVI